MSFLIKVICYRESLWSLSFFSKLFYVKFFDRFICFMISKLYLGRSDR